MLLAINTVTEQVELNLWNIEQKVLLAKKVWEKDKNESDKLLPNIVSLLDANNFNLADIKQILVINGPGSFVSVRLGVLIANTLVQNLKEIEMFSLNTFEYLGLAEADFVILDAGGKEVYLYDCHKKTFEIQKLEECHPDTNKSFVIASKFIENFEKLKQIEQLSLENAVMKMLTLNLLKDFKVANPPLEVNYVKDPSIQKDGLNTK